MKMDRTRETLERIANYLFLITVFFIPMELAVDLRIGRIFTPYKLFLLLLILTVGILVSRDPVIYRRISFDALRQMYRRMRRLLIPLGLYFLFDLVSLFWTADVWFALKKYITILPMVVLSLYGGYYFYDPRLNFSMRYERFRSLTGTIGLMALALALISWGLFLFYGRTYYILRMSLQSDYNQYIISIFLGFLCGIYRIHSIKDSRSQLLLFFLYSVLILPLFYISGSRRTMLLYMPVFGIIGVGMLLSAVQQHRRGLIIGTMVCVLSATALHFALIDYFEVRSARIYQEMEDEAIGNGQELVSASMDKREGIVQGFRLEQGLEFKTQTIASGDAIGIRERIWARVMEELGSFSAREWLIGRGGSYQRDLLSGESSETKLFPEGRPDGTKMPKHPHSMVFVDLLNGGVIKLGLTVLTVFAVLSYSAVLIRAKDGPGSLLLLLYGGFHLSSQFIDSIYGLWESRLTWLLVMLLMGLLCLLPINTWMGTNRISGKFES